MESDAVSLWAVAKAYIFVVGIAGGGFFLFRGISYFLLRWNHGVRTTHYWHIMIGNWFLSFPSALHITEVLVGGREINFALAIIPMTFFILFSSLYKKEVRG